MYSFLKKYGSYLAGTVFLLTALFLYSHYFQSDKQTESLQLEHKIQKHIQALSDAQVAFLRRFSFQNDAQVAWKSSHLDFRYTPALFLYHKNHLSFWTQNSLPITRQLSDNQLNFKGIVQLKNGWYYQQSIKKGSYTLVGFFLIKNAYPYENENLKNEFSEDFTLHFGAEISTNKKEPLQIHAADGSYLFSLTPNDTVFVSKDIQIGVFILFLLGVCCFIYALIAQFIQHTKYKKAASFVFFLLLLASLLLLHTFQFAFFGTFELFQPQLYASAVFMPSLGNLFIGIALIAVFCLFLFKHVSVHKLKNKAVSTSLLYLSPFLYYFIAYSLSLLLKSIVDDSSIPLYTNDIMDLNTYSYMLWFFMSLLALSFFVFSAYLHRFYSLFLPSKKGLVYWFTVSLFYVFFLYFYLSAPWFVALFAPVLSYLLYRIQVKLHNHYSFGMSLLLLGVFVAYLDASVYVHLFHKERKSREVYAKKLISEQDPETEIEYAQISGTIAHSSYLENILQTKQNYRVSDLKENLEAHFFNGFWERYEKDFYLYSIDSTSLVNFSFSEEANFSYFSRILYYHSKRSSIDAHIYYVADYIDKLSYLICQPILSGDSICGYLLVGLKSKAIPKEIGFPRLLLSNRAKVFLQLEDYSMAKYINGKLVFRYGECNYPLTSQAFFKEVGRKKGFVNNVDFSHYLYSDHAHHLVVLSKSKLVFSNYLASFSFLFVFLGFTLLLLLSLFKSEFLQLRRMHLAFKIQLILIGLVFFSLVFFSWGAGSFVSSQYNSYTTDLIREKITSVATDLKQKIRIEDLTSAESANFLEYTLQRFSGVFVTDLALYNPKGDLLASSRPKIYHAGLLSEMMSPWAYRMLNYRSKSEIIFKEKIGTLSYLSAYIPILDKKDTVVAYLNLQYFAHQNQFEKELASFLTAILTVFVFLLALAVIISVFVTNWITSPLKLIQKSIASFTLGTSAQPILYSGKDEIGALVKEYNQKLQELEEKANELAKSERESAWREMAKQVAHEIKNPLTPIKLSLQQLQRSFSSGESVSQEKVQQIAESIIEQVDTLTKIANEFSNFAKLPRPNQEKIDLLPLAKNAVEVFANEVTSSEIQFQSSLSTCYVLADKDMLLRVFNNLLKNALQAIPDKQKGKIVLSIEEKKNLALFTVTDNGTGIPNDLLNKLFVPNFTTKSTGTGLGLAMVKQIIENHNGKIWFETALGQGTSFFFELPKS